MEDTPACTKRPSAIYLCSLLASGGWSVGWPVLYAVFLDGLPPTADFIFFTHAAATVWFIALIVFFWLLTVLVDILGILDLVLNILAALM